MISCESSERVVCLDEHGLRPGPLEHSIAVRHEDPPLARVSGVVLDDAGRPLPRARITREDGGPIDNDHVSMQLKAADGSFLWIPIRIELAEALSDPIGPGSYTVEASVENCAAVHVSVVIEAGVTREIELLLPTKTER